MCLQNHIREIEVRQNNIRDSISDGVKTYANIKRNYDSGEIKALMQIFQPFYGLRFPQNVDRQEIGNIFENRENLTLAAAIRRISIRGCQFSFATKVLHTVNNNHPIIDKHVRKFFALGAVRGATFDDKIQSAQAIYNTLCNCYGNRENNGLNRLVAIFDDHFPDTDFSDVKKIDFMIWGWGRCRNNR